MDVQSMTGFGKGESADSDYCVMVEIKSVNHRFKDVRFKMPNIFSSVELQLRRKLTQKFRRGSFDVFVTVKRTEAIRRFDDLDPQKISAFVGKIKSLLPEVDIRVNPVDFLRSEFYLEQETNERLLGLLEDAFAGALTEIESSRKVEGAKLVEVIANHLECYRAHYSQIMVQAEQFKQHVEDKLKKRLHEYSAEIKLEESRFWQEVVYYLEKLDVTEELNRISSHLQKLSLLLSDKEEVGRQFEFLLQELNRETNTIGSKSSMEEISNLVVLMKVELEKLREQALNIE